MKFLIVLATIAQLAFAKEPETVFERGLRELSDEDQKIIALLRMVPKNPRLETGTYFWEHINHFVEMDSKSLSDLEAIFCWDDIISGSWNQCSGASWVTISNWKKCLGKEYIKVRDGPECDRSRQKPVQYWVTNRAEAMKRFKSVVVNHDD